MTTLTLIGVAQMHQLAILAAIGLASISLGFAVDANAKPLGYICGQGTYWCTSSLLTKLHFNYEGVSGEEKRPSRATDNKTAPLGPHTGYLRLPLHFVQNVDQLTRLTLRLGGRLVGRRGSLRPIRLLQDDWYSPRPTGAWTAAG